MAKRLALLLVALGVLGAGLLLRQPDAPPAGLAALDDGDAIFWLSQGGASDRFITCAVYFHFDRPLAQEGLEARLKALVEPYALFKRNVVEQGPRAFWQSRPAELSSYLKVLAAGEDLEALRRAAEAEFSRGAVLGSGAPLFRAFLANEGKTLLFLWHHVLSDFEGMYNKQAAHLFDASPPRTRFGYQLGALASTPAEIGRPVALRYLFDRPVGVKAAGFGVEKLVLPWDQDRLADRAAQAGLGMSDVFSLMALRALALYYQDRPESTWPALPLVSPLSLRASASALDEGNNRALKQFEHVIPPLPMAAMVDAVASLPPAMGSYDRAGAMMKQARVVPGLEGLLRRVGMPEFISNYFPLADDVLHLGPARLTDYAIRVPMMPFEEAKFAWSNYNGEVALFLHTDPKRVVPAELAQAARQAVGEVLAELDAP